MTAIKTDHSLNSPSAFVDKDKQAKSQGYCSILKKTFSITKKAVGTAAADFFSMIPVAVVCGKTGNLLNAFGFINKNTAKLLDGTGFNLSVKNPLIRSAAKIFETYLEEPVVNLRDFLFEYTPNLKLGGHNLSRLFVATTLEELACRGLIQRFTLPLLSKALPKRLGDILNHQVTRVALTSLMFALAHTQALDSPAGIAPQFMGGVVLGAAAELNNGLAVPILAHFINDFFLGTGKRL